MHFEEISKIIDEITSSVELYVEKHKEHIEAAESAQENERVVFFASLKKYANDFYKQLNLSVLEADYISDASLKDELSGAVAKLEQCAESFSDSELYLQEAQKFYRYVSFIKHDINAYIHQINLYDRSINEPHKFLIGFNSNVSSSDKEYNGLELKNASKVFQLNLDLMLFDRELSLRNYSFHEINDLFCNLSALKKDIQESYLDALLHKCKILEAKFYYKDEIGGLLDAFNYDNGHFEDIDLKVDEIGYVSKKLREINTRDIKKYEQNVSSYFHRIEQPHSSFDFFVACHYYKNIALDEASLKKLVDDYAAYISQETKGISTEDIHRRKVNLSYLKNCHFSYILKNDNLTPSKVDILSKEAISSQNQAGIGNHFCFYKTACWYRDYINNQIEKKVIEECLREYLERLKDNITKAENKLYERSRDATSFIPFMPEISECYEEFKSEPLDSTIKIFISTSYIVPVDYSKTLKQVEELKEDYLRLRSVVEASLVMKDGLLDVSGLKKETEDAIEKQKNSTDKVLSDLDSKFKSELSDNLKNSIQILSIFSAIVVFASGTIQIFTGATTVKDATIFMIMFASALGLVALFVRNCFVSRKEWDARDIVYSIVLVIILAMTGLGIFADWGGRRINVDATDNTEQMQIVSLDTVTKRDSVKVDFEIPSNNEH